MFKVLRLVSIFLAFMFCNSAHAEGNGSWLPDRMLVDKIESQLLMPANAKPLDAFMRYYTGIQIDGKLVVIGTFVQETENTGVSIVPNEKLPKYVDGGCSIVQVDYDVDASKVRFLYCNGEA